MATIHDSYLGVGEESSYGTAVAVDTFFEMASESIQGNYERIDSAAFRAGQRVLRSDRFAPNPKGASGSVEFEVLDAGFGLLLEHMLGDVSSGSPGGSPSMATHTFTPGSLAGKSLTFQVGRTDNQGVLHPFTYYGGKIVSWELSNEVDGILNLSLELDFLGEHAGVGAGAYAVSSPSYVSGAQLFTFIGGAVKIGGVDFKVSNVTVGVNNGLAVDRWHLGGGKREPLEQGLREITFSLTGEFESLTHYQRVASLTAAGAVASLYAEWESPRGGKLTVTIPAARFDSGPVNFEGAEIIPQELSGVGTWNGTDQPITLTYTSTETSW